MLTMKRSVFLSLVILLPAGCDDAADAAPDVIVGAVVDAAVDTGPDAIADAAVPDAIAAAVPDAIADAVPDAIVDAIAEAEISIEDTTEVADGQLTPGACAGEAHYCAQCGGDWSWLAECVNEQWVCIGGGPESDCPPCPCCDFAGKEVSGGPGCGHPLFCVAWDRSTQWCNAEPGHPTTVEGTTVLYGAEGCADPFSWLHGTTTLEITGAAFSITWSESTETVAGTATYDATSGALSLVVDGTPPAGFDGEGTLYGGTGDKTPIMVDMALGAPSGEETACGYTMGAPPIDYQ